MWKYLNVRSEPCWLWGCRYPSLCSTNITQLGHDVRVRPKTGLRRTVDESPFADPKQAIGCDHVDLDQWSRPKNVERHKIEGPRFARAAC